MEKLSVNWRLYLNIKLLDYANGLKNLLADYEPAVLGFSFQYDEFLEFFEAYKTGISKTTRPIKISRKELDNQRNDAFKSLLHTGRAASTDDDPIVQSAGEQFISLVNKINRHLTRSNYAVKTANIITLLKVIKKNQATFMQIPAFGYYLPKLKKAQEAFREGTNFKTHREATLKSIPSATTVRQKLIGAIDRLFSKLVILEYEARHLTGNDLQESLSYLIRKIATHNQITRRRK